MAKNINKDPFDEATQLKLEIFRECFREWLPVFIHNPTIEKIYIYDFFAGSGTDSEGNPGSPLILLNEAKGNNCSNCNSIGEKKATFAFNEFLDDKNKELKDAVNSFIVKCLEDNCNKDECLYKWHLKMLLTVKILKTY